ncbi:tyrosine recombinase XerC [mine drainage metagenome]|uniref:Tyrosine recombinase XerC n=1 Tax=mine drainage metagenome TaxID=410659 RepID=A0A1J5RNU4_9ZZZZ
MALANHIHREESGRYHARLRVPQDLVEVIGKKELWKACNTTDPETAKDEKARIIAEWRAWFKELRQKRAATDHDIQRVVYDFYRQEVELSRRDRAQLPAQADIDAERRAMFSEIDAGEPSFSRMFDVAALEGAAELMRMNRTSQMAELKKHLAENKSGLIEWATDDIIQREGFAIEKGSAEYRDLCHRLQRAQLEALQRAAEVDQGKFDGKPTDEMVKPPVGSLEAVYAAPGESIMELYDQFCRENPGGISLDTQVQNRKIVKLFAEFVGEASPVTSITKAAVRDWKKALFSWPLKAAEIKVFKGMSFREVLKANEDVGKPAISEKTINKYLSAMGGFCEWLRGNDYIEGDPMDGMFLKLDKEEKTVFPYTTEQLKAIFAAPVFTGAQSSEDDHLPGNVHIGDWRRWLPLIGLFTGARLGEIAQLYLADVRQEHGHWIFHITRETARDGDVKKTTKTKGSQRVIPVHSELIKLGFLDYFAAVRERGEMRLFPEIKPDTRGHMSGHPSRWYGRYVAKIGVKDDKSVNFHSFRHGLADAFRRAGYLDEQFKMMLGHTGATTTGRYGKLPEGELRQRVEMIEAVSFPGLVLTH